MTLQEAREQFPTATIVQLKSGGPKMIVVKVGQSHLGDLVPNVFCKWFDGAKLSEEWFEPELLNKA